MGRTDSKLYSTFSYHFCSAPRIVFKYQATEGEKMLLGINRPATLVDLE
jgi:hypothetical protein